MSIGKKYKRNDAFILGKTQINNNKIIAGFMNFDFMGGSMGRAVGGGIVKGAFKKQLLKNVLIYYLLVLEELECKKE